MGTPADPVENQVSRHTPRQMAALGFLVTALGMLCIGGGLALLIWRVAQPEKAVILPPGYAGTPEPTPTPGVLREVRPPPIPDDPAKIVMLPAGERAPAGANETDLPSATRMRTDAPLPTGSPTATRTPAPTPTLLPAIPDRIVIGAIGLDAPVVPVGQHALILEGQLYSQWEVPNQPAVGWHIGSAPLGQPGNTVLNGHHNVYGEVFRYLLALQPGDRVTLVSLGQPYDYIVAQTMTLAEEGQPVEVRRANARWILPTQDERVTLITCWPYEASSHRLVVVALPLAALGDTVEPP